MLIKEIIAAFTRLNKELAQQDIYGEIGVVGGAAMVLAFNARGATKDVDAIFKPSTKIREAAVRVAEELGLEKDWINDAVKGFLPGDPNKKIFVIKKDYLRIWVPEPEYILAMKSISARFDTKDSHDIKFLIKHLAIKSKEEVLDLIQGYYPNRMIPSETQFFYEELFDK